MSRPRRSLLATATLVLVALLVPASPSAAGPVKCDDGDLTPDDRVFPEPRNSQTFLRFDEFQCAMAYLESLHPDRIDITTVAESPGGLPVYDVLLTDETVPADGKQQLMVVNSIHANEVGGREGGVRVIEDMVDERFLAGEDWVQQVLDGYVIHFLFPNPDGWVSGDLVGTPGAGGLATRGNDNGRDLNRQFPVRGYINRNNQTFSQPEAQGVVENLFKAQPDGWYLATDNHGQGPDTYAAAGLQIVGQFDYQKSETLARFADGITEAMAEYDVLEDLATLREVTGADLGPYHWGTLYDMLGYSASGSLIDYYNTADGLDGTGFATELTIGTEVNIALHGPLLNQVYVDAIRAINFTMFRHAVEPVGHIYAVGGRAAYLYDPEVIRHDDDNGAGYQPAEDEIQTVEPYRVTRMRFFEDLNRYADQPLDQVRVGEVLDGSVDLRQYDSLVVANDALPEAADLATWVAALRGWVEAGGNLVVTDAAAPLLAELGLVGPEDVAMAPDYVGSVEEFVNREHPLNANLRGVASQTFDTVPLGYAFPPAPETAPNWTVAESAWSAGGGESLGRHGAGRTVYGQKPFGQGVVRFLGALLPDPTEDYYHPYGIQNYAVTYTGYTLLANMLAWSNPGRVEPEPEVPETPVAEPAEVGRIAAADRIGTAVALSAEAFDAADVALLARADDFPDALAASGLAAELDAPVLLTSTGGLDARVREELERLGAGEAVLLGGEAALSEQVEEDLDQTGVDHRRVGGRERFETAALVADEVVRIGGAVDRAVVALGARADDGDAWPDAIAAGSLAAAARAPVLLTRSDELPEVTGAALGRLLAEGQVVHVTGGPAAVNEDVAREIADAGYDVRRLGGATRYDTAVAVLDAALGAGADPDPLLLASGEVFADALTGAPAAHHLGGALLLVHPRDLDSSPASRRFVEEHAGITSALVLGGTEAVSDDVLNEVRTLLDAE